MKSVATILALALTSCLAHGSCLAQGEVRSVAADSQTETKEPSSKISIRVEKSASGERIVIDEILIDAPVAAVWEAYTTSKGWMAWVAPVAEVDFRIGGRIRTNYDADAKVGDPGTIVLHIVNFVPRRILTLQAELQNNWPEIMKSDAEHLMSVIVFDSLSDRRTRVTAYAVGYGDSPVYDDMLGFFVEANEGLYRKLIDYLEAE